MTKKYSGVNPGFPAEFRPWTPENAEFNVRLHPDRLTKPFSWRKPRRVFVDSMSDLFHSLVPFEFVEAVWGVMALAPQHTFQILTKRPERMRDFIAQLDTRKIKLGMVRALKPNLLDGGHNNILDQLPEKYRDIERSLVDPVLSNVWLGTSVENARWRSRIDALRDIPAAVRFLSCEPLLGSLTDWTKVEVAPHELGRVFFDLTGIDWVIVGAESGKDRRPYDMEWARQIRDACVAGGVGFFYKQSAGFRSGHHPYLTEKDGTCWKWEQDPGVLTPPEFAHDVTGCEDAGQRQETMAL